MNKVVEVNEIEKWREFFLFIYFAKVVGAKFGETVNSFNLGVVQQRSSEKYSDC